MGVKSAFPILLFFMICSSAYAQDTLKPPTVVHKIDSAKVTNTTDTVNVKKHSPLKAGLASAILPGAGQFYNRKYWKIPILYAGIAVDVYFIISNRQYYNEFRNAYLINQTGNMNTTNQYAFIYTPDQLLSIQQYYQKYYDLSFILGGVIYALNILDAVVDAHLFYFDVSEKLSMQITPIINPLHLGYLANAGSTGLNVQLNF